MGKVVMSLAIFYRCIREDEIFLDKKTFMFLVSFVQLIEVILSLFSAKRSSFVY